jgi:hypothetical protein
MIRKWLALIFLICVMPLVSVQAQPATESEIESAVMKVLDEWMVAFNKMDMKAWEKTFHFPHDRLAGGDMKILKKAGEQNGTLIKLYFKTMGWHHSAWNHRRIIHLSETKVHVDTKFTRYREDGSIIGTFESLYVLTYEKGRWGIKLRSSFAR